MKVSYQDGKICLDGRYFQEARYDLSNEKICVAADGCGGLTSYRVNNRAEDLIVSFLSLEISLGGKPLSPYLRKTVEMIGRMQKITLFTEEGELSITTFLSRDTNGVFFLVKGETPMDLTLNCRGAKGESTSPTCCVKGENFLLSSSQKGEWVKENDCFYLSSEREIRLLFSFLPEQEDHLAAFRAFDERLEGCLKEIADVRLPSSLSTEEEKAMYLSAHFTALENFKTAGDFRAFAAGIRYIDPLRTYYRDSYFTVLAALSSHPDLVRDELLTLARGIAADGSCPSAVKSDFTAFWGDHYDSPSFFVAELYDYLRATKDLSILSAQSGGHTLLEKVKAVLDRLEKSADDTGLLFKAGDYNKRDWADEVNRGGYVTFVEAMYYRALTAAAEIFKGRDDALSEKYGARAERVKEAINAILFDEEKGYYVNYKTHDRVEDNLSVDTIFTLLFGIADEEKAKRVLDNMERLLETRHNAEQGGGDFGVMCVYPPYSLPRATCNKSARPYDYHNGANWCYLTAIYAYAKSLYGRDWRTPLLSTFRYMVANGHYTPVEYFSPCRPAGSPLQGWSAAIAFVWDKVGEKNFF